MVADVLVIAFAVTLEIPGGPARAVVAKEEFGELADIPDEFVETTENSYVVPGVKPVRITE
jgi:hypothetical protein